MLVPISINFCRDEEEKEQTEKHTQREKSNRRFLRTAVFDHFFLCRSYTLTLADTHTATQLYS